MSENVTHRHYFHPIHGNGIALDINQTIASRANRNGNGVVFTSQPIRPNETIWIDFLEIREVPGVVNIGFTSTDPSSLRFDVLESFVDSLYPHQEFWYCQLPASFYTIGNVYFYVTPDGVINYGNDFENRTGFDTKVNTHGNLWAFIDILSPSTTIQLRSRDQPSRRATTTQQRSQGVKNIYAFSSRPLKINENVVFKIWKECDSFVFGVTSCDSKRIEHFPHNPELLLDRPELWILINEPSWTFRQYDELSYTITPDGQMKIWKNDTSLVKVVPVNHTSDLWGFFVMDPVQGVTVSTSAWNIFRKVAEVTLPAIPSAPLPEPTVPEQSEDDSSKGNENPRECSICCEKEANAVLYRCGHMCLCYGCAMNQWRGQGDGRCPLCRREIEDVIKPYR